MARVSIEDVLDAQAQVESGGNPRARSPVGAMGLHQFMPATWRQYGQGKNPYDPVASRDAAKRYLSDLYSTYHSLPLALAAYNGGAGGADYLSRNSQFIDHPDKNAPSNTWRNQTAGYVHKILNMLNPISDANADETPYQEPVKKINQQSNDDFYKEFDDFVKNSEPSPQQNQQSNDDLYAEFAKFSQEKQPQQPQEYTDGNTIIGDLAHKAGVSARGILEGISGVPEGIYNTLGMLSPANAVEVITGKKVPGMTRNIDTSKERSEIIDKTGLPKATEDDYITHAVSKGLAGFVVPTFFASKAGGAVGAVGDFLGGKNPGTVLAGITGGATAQELAKRKGATENQQLMANIAGNLVGGIAPGILGAVGGGTKTLGQVLTNNLESTAGRTLNRAAGDEAGLVARNLNRGLIPTVSGLPILAHKPTSTEIAGNAGIANILRQAEISADTATPLAARRLENAKAISDYAQRQMVGREGYIPAKEAALWEKVNTISLPMRQRDLPVDLSPVATQLANAIQKNKGNPAVIAALTKIQNSLPAAGGMARFNETYNFKQWIDEALRSKNLTDPEIMSLQKARTALEGVRKSLSDTMTKTEPGFDDFLKEQAKGLASLNAREKAAAMLEKAQLKTPLVSNASGSQQEVFPLAPASLVSLLRNPSVQKNLTPAQLKVLQKAQQTATAATRRNAGMMTGSPTAQNLKISEAIADDLAKSFVGNKKEKLASIVRHAVTPLVKTGHLIGIAEENALRDVLARAELDPKYAAELMRKYKPGSPQFNDSITRALIRGNLTEK
jgi:hypothetical protein